MPTLATVCFENDRRLTKGEMDALLTWLDTGMANWATRRTCPQPRAFADGWVIGKPDVIFELPEEQTVPATGVVPYEYFVTPTNFKEDVWIQAAEARPGNRGVVHHIIVSYRDPKNQRARQQRPRALATASSSVRLLATCRLILPPGMATQDPGRCGTCLADALHAQRKGRQRTNLRSGLIFYKGKEPPKFECTNAWHHQRQFCHSARANRISSSNRTGCCLAT